MRWSLRRSVLMRLFAVMQGCVEATHLLSLISIEPSTIIASLRFARNYVINYYAACHLCCLCKHNGLFAICSGLIFETMILNQWNCLPTTLKKIVLTKKAFHLMTHLHNSTTLSLSISHCHVQVHWCKPLC